MADASGTVLVVDDDAAVAVVLASLLRQDGLEAVLAASGEQALQALSSRAFDLVVTDLRMPGIDGLQLLAQVGARFPGLPVIMLTAHGSVPLAVEAMKAGAVDFVLKPFDRQEILYAVRKAMAVAPHEEHPVPAPSAGLVGESAPMREAVRLIDRAAQSEATVLLLGESGTGKELAAREVHQRSHRRAGPFVKVHCAALPDALLESELFGYEKGAFTGAACRKPGRVELSEGGTLFLDEMGDVTPAVQVKLLRLLQDRAYERLGGTQTLAADVRFVAATHRNLEEMVKAGQFREDLYYRLNVVPIWLPPLRDRPSDIDRLAQHFCSALAASSGKPPLALTPGALALLRAARWPGNVRQLQNFIERLIVFSDGPALDVADVERELARQPGPARAAGPAAAATLDSRRREGEREALQDALSRAQGNRTLAARLLGVSRRTLYNKLAEHQRS